jgi:hypothetical protein
VCGSILTPTFAQVPSYVPTNGLVGWWPFNGNANDDSGNGNNLTNVGGVLSSSDRFGNPLSAYLFQSNGQYLKKDNPVLPSGNSNRTVSVWYRFLSGTNGPTLISQWDGVQNGTCNTSFSLQGWNEGIIFWGRCNDRSVGFSLDTNWIHIVVVYENSYMKFYKNGVLINDPGTPNYYNFTTSLSTSLHEFRVGHPGVNASYPSQFNGYIDDIGMWNRALTQSEITALYNGCNFSNVSIVPAGATTFCQGNSVTLNANKTSTSYTYTWSLNGSSISGAASSSYVATQSGSYTLKIDSGGCFSVSSPVNVTVNELPSLSFSMTPYVNIQQSALSLSALPAGGAFSGKGISGSTFYPTSAGLGIKNITYTYTDANNCTNSVSQPTLVYDTLTCFVSVTDTLIIKAALTGVNPPNNTNTVKIYPNPAKDQITIDFGNYTSISGYTITIKNLLGQTVYTSTANKQQTTVSLNSWTGRGTYLVELTDGSGKTVEIRKIILE